MTKNMMANCKELRRSFPATPETATIGIDLGDRYSHCCFLGPDGVVLSEGRVRTTPEAIESHSRIYRPAESPSKSARTHVGLASCCRIGVMRLS
ncbi:MAG TPA: hypothetical protein VK578_03405 [Edaphobacter sp.]|nr:hypothetical protein [Edaphobacter sp.]